MLAESAEADSIVRVMTDDGGFRVIVADTTRTVRGAVEAQSARDATARHFGELLTGAVLFRETMAPTLRVQGVLRGATGGQIVADSHPSGSTRGLVEAPERLVLGDGARLRVMRSLPGGGVLQGVVAAPEFGGISGALMNYLRTSEQVDSVIAVGAIVDAEHVHVAGGYLVQLLPEVEREALAAMTSRLQSLTSIEALLSRGGFSTTTLIDELLGDMPYTPLEKRPVEFGCWCSRVRMLATLTTLSRPELEDMIADGEVLEISCSYCRAEYGVAPEELRGLLQPS